MIRGLQAGARGFLLKDTSREALVNTMHAAARGDSLLGPGVVECLLARVGAVQKQPALPAGPPLSERDLEVLQAVAWGETNKGVVVQLGISERTVKAHLASVYNKLGVDSRAPPLPSPCNRAGS